MNDPTKCSERVYTNGFIGSQCKFKIWKDGFCRIHHPETVEKRNKKSEERYREQQKKSPWYLLGKANERIVELETEIKRLRELCERRS